MFFSDEEATAIICTVAVSFGGLLYGLYRTPCIQELVKECKTSIKECFTHNRNAELENPIRQPEIEVRINARDMARRALEDLRLRYINTIVVRQENPLIQSEISPFDQIMADSQSSLEICNVTEDNSNETLSRFQRIQLKQNNVDRINQISSNDVVINMSMYV